MHQHAIEHGAGQIRRIAKIGMGLNIILAILQIIVGYIAGSLALITDGFHTLSDMFSDLAVMIGVHFGSKEPDLEHPWGHGRMETFAATLISLVLIGVGAIMIYKSITSIYQGHQTVPNWAVLIVAATCVVSKEWLYWLARAVAKKTGSTALYASAWHHRSDALSSIAVILGFIALKSGFGYGDQVAAIVVGIMIVMVGARIFNECLSEFAEKAVDEEFISEIENTIKSDSRIRQFHNLRTRSVGREIFLDVHILVDPALSVTEAHDISESLENSLRSQFSQPVNIIVHMEPDISRLRSPGVH